MGKESPTKSAIVKQVKSCFIKKSNSKKKVGNSSKRRGTTIEDIKVLVKSFYRKPASKVLPQRRRFLVMQLFTFFGMKRFSDISDIRVDDIEFRKDNSLKVTVRKSKTDQLMRGAHFTLSGSKSKGFSLTEIVKWYIDSIGLEKEDFLFPRFRKGKGTEIVPIQKSPVSYTAARQQLKQEQARLGLEGLTWHSGRIGGASAAARAGLNTELIIKPCGEWKSSAVDTYIRTDEPGVVFSQTMVNQF